MSARRPLLFLNASAELGGAERGLLQILESLPRDRPPPWVLVPEVGPLQDWVEARGARSLVLPFPSALRRLSRGSGSLGRLAAGPGLLAYLGRLCSRIRRLRPALLWSNGIKFHYLGALAGLLTGTPVLAHLRDLSRPPGFPLLLDRLCHLVVVNSPETARVAGAPRGRTLVLPNAVPWKAMRRAAPSRAEARAQLGYEEGELVVLAVGALTEHKGQLRLFESFLGLLEEFPRARLVLVGGEPYRTAGHGGVAATIQERAREAGVGDRVALRGVLSDPWPEYRAADLFALPSLSEGFGRVYLEAAAFAVPVLASERGGTRDIFAPGQALLLDPEDPARWTEAMLQLAREPRARRELGEAGARRARDFDLVHLPRRLAPVLHRALGGS